MILVLKDFVESLQIFLMKSISMIMSLIKIVVLSRFNTRIPKAEKRDVVVIGNAPSLKDVLTESPDFFKNKDLVCVNAFPSSPEFELFKPSVLVWLDNAYYPRKGVELRPDIKVLLDTIVKKTNWKLKIFLPQISRSAEHLKELSRNPNIQLHYFNYTIIEGFDWFCYFFYKRNIGMPLCQNVVAASVFLSINMNYKNIYLAGVQNSFFKDIVVGDGNEIYLQHSHFYDKDNKGSLAKMHKRPGSPEQADIADVLMMAVKTFRGYKNVKRYADYKGANIYNITKDSYVDAFERKQISDLK